MQPKSRFRIPPIDPNVTQIPKRVYQPVKQVVPKEENDIPQEINGNDPLIHQAIQRASVHSIKSEQSFRRGQAARDTVQEEPPIEINLDRDSRFEKDEGTYVPIANQPHDLLDPLLIRLSQYDPKANLQRNLYRISPFQKNEDCSVYKDAKGFIQNLEQSLIATQPEELDRIWEAEAFQQPNQNPLKNQIFKSVKASKIKIAQYPTVRLSDVIAFQTPPLLLPLTNNPLKYEQEIKVLRATAELEYDHENEEVMEQRIQKFRADFLEILTRIKQKFVHEQKISEYIRVEWQELYDYYTNHQQNHETILNQILDFTQNAGKDEIAKRKYLDLAQKTEEQSNQEQMFLRRVNQAYNFCISTKSTGQNPQIQQYQGELDHLRLDEISHMVSEIYHQNIAENQKNLQIYFIWMSEKERWEPDLAEDKEIINFAKEFKNIYQFLDDTYDKIFSQVLKFTSFLECIRKTLTEQTNLFISLAANFLTQCQEFDHLFGFQKKCKKLILILQQGLSQLQAIKIPTCSQKYRNFNDQLIDNSNLYFLRAEQKLNKYLRSTLTTFPEEIREDVLDERRRKDVAKSYKKQFAMEKKDLKELMKEPLMLAQRLECFSMCTLIRDLYKKHIEDCKGVKETFMSLPKLEVRIYQIQGEREKIKDFFLRTQNKQIVESQLQQLKNLIEDLKKIKQNLWEKKWDAYNFKSIKVNYKITESTNMTLDASKAIHNYDIELSFHDKSLPQCVPHQIQRLMQWIQSELQALENLEQLHMNYLQGYSETRQMIYDKALSTNIKLIARVKAVTKLEPSIDDILNKTVQADKEYYEVLEYIYETTLKPDSEDKERLDYSRIQTSLSLDQELEEHLDYLTKQKYDQTQSSFMKEKFQILYQELSDLYTKYTIWQNVQSCRLIMDGQIFSTIIKSTTLFPVSDEPSLPYQYISLFQAQEVMKRLMRAFSLNIKNSEHCVFFKIYVEEGLRIIAIILRHYEALKQMLKLSYQEKKAAKLEDQNSGIMRECMQILDDPNISLRIIREPLISGINYFLNKNTVQFRTKGATLDWDKQIDDTRKYIIDIDEILQRAHDYLKEIMSTDLLKVYKVKAPQGKLENQKINFEPGDFYLQSEPLGEVQKSKLRISKVRVDCENLVNNQVDQQEYKFRFVYLIGVIDETLLWIKAIESIAKVTYMTMGKIKDILDFDESPSSDYLRQMRLFIESIDMNIKDIKGIEVKSPFSFKINKVSDAWTPPEDFKIVLQSATPIDSQLLLIHKIAKLTAHSMEIIHGCVTALLSFQKLREIHVQIDEEFFTLLERFIIFYSKGFKQEKKKIDELAKPIFIKETNDKEFYETIKEIPEYCPYPKEQLRKCMTSLQPVIEQFMEAFDMEHLTKLNKIIQTYQEENDNPILSLNAFAADHTQILRFDYHGKQGQSRQQLQNYAAVCRASIPYFSKFIDFVGKVKKMTNDDDPSKKENQEGQVRPLFRLKDFRLWKNFVDKECMEWTFYLERIYTTAEEYFNDLEAMKIQQKEKYLSVLDSKSQRIQEQIVQMKADAEKNKSSPKTQNLELLYQLYRDLIELFTYEHQSSV